MNMNSAILNLSAPALRYVAEMCKLRPHFRVGIICGTSDDAASALDQTLDYVDWTAYKSQIRREDSAEVAFKNGSQIIFITQNANMRGYKWHIALMGDGVDKNVAREVTI